MMLTSPISSWIAVFMLGAVHGVNPAMGWLFAVARGLQEDRRSALLGTLGPLALGHALAIAVVLMLAASAGLLIPVGELKWVIAVMLCTLGILQLRRHYHPRGGMRVGVRDLTLWSFLVATAHGAGLMALPFVVGTTNGAMHAHAHHSHTLLAGVTQPQLLALFATALHTVGYLGVTVVVALLVYEKLGLRLLQTAWVNINLLWALTLIVTGLLTPFV